MDNNNDLKELIQEDKQHIINFLKHHKLRIKNDEVELLFSRDIVGDIQSSLYPLYMVKRQFTNLWQLNDEEPQLVWCSFNLQRPTESKKKLHTLFRRLLPKITSREWHELPTTIPSNSQEPPNTCVHYQSINIFPKQSELEIILIGAICYCS